MCCSLAGNLHCALHAVGSSENGRDAFAKAQWQSSNLRELDLRPRLAIWEMARSCHLGCARCPTKAEARRHPLELSTAEAFHLIDQLAHMQVPLFVLTGGDPLERPDLLPIIEYAARREVRSCLTLSPTPRLTREIISRFKDSALTRLAFGLDGSTAPLHDGFRGTRGSYLRTLAAIDWCREAGLSVQVNTILSRHNFADLERMIKLLNRIVVSVWNIFFLVPLEPAQFRQMLRPEEHEQAFETLYDATQRVKFYIRTTEAPHYGRYLLERTIPGPLPDVVRRAPEIDEGKDMVFIDHTGAVYASAFLPLPAGNLLWEPLAEIFRNSPLFRTLRDGSQLKGKCGRCEFQQVCGGSRARAYAANHDVLGEEPCCGYVPRSKSRA